MAEAQGRDYTAHAGFGRILVKLDAGHLGGEQGRSKFHPVAGEARTLGKDRRLQRDAVLDTRGPVGFRHEAQAAIIDPGPAARQRRRQGHAVCEHFPHQVDTRHRGGAAGRRLTVSQVGEVVVEIDVERIGPGVFLVRRDTDWRRRRLHG